MAQGYFFYGHCTLITTGINKCCIYIENKKILADFFLFFNIFFCRLNLHSVFCCFLNKYLFFVSSLHLLRLRITQKALRQPFFFSFQVLFLDRLAKVACVFPQLLQARVTNIDLLAYAINFHVMCFRDQQQRWIQASM